MAQFNFFSMMAAFGLMAAPFVLWRKLQKHGASLAIKLAGEGILATVYAAAGLLFWSLLR